MRLMIAGGRHPGWASQVSARRIVSYETNGSRRPTSWLGELVVCKEDGIYQTKGSHREKKSGLTMDFFRKGSDPPPLIFESYGTREAHLSFGHQKRGKT